MFLNEFSAPELSMGVGQALKTLSLIGAFSQAVMQECSKAS